MSDFSKRVELINAAPDASIDVGRLMARLAQTSSSVLSVERDRNSPSGYHWTFSWIADDDKPHIEEAHRLHDLLWQVEVKHQRIFREYADSIGADAPAELPLFGGLD